MSKHPNRSRQLELPVLVSLSGSEESRPSVASRAIVGQASQGGRPFKQASPTDEAIYRSISDNYFSHLD